MVYHNKYADTRGWIRTSVAYAVKFSQEGSISLVQKSLAESLGVSRETGSFTVYREHPTGLEYLRENQKLWSEGLYVELGAYDHHVFLDFRQVQDNEWGQYAQLCAYLDGRGVPDIEAAAKELLLRPVHQPFRELVNAGMFRWVIEARQDPETWPEIQEQTTEKVTHLLEEVARFSQSSADISRLAQSQMRKLQALLELESEAPAASSGPAGVEPQAENIAAQESDLEMNEWGVLLGWLFTHQLGEVASEQESESISRAWIDEWLLGKMLETMLRDLGIDPQKAWEGVGLVKLLTTHHNWHGDGQAGEDTTIREKLRSWLGDPDVQAYLQLNRYQGILWFNREAFERMVRALLNVAAIEIHAAPDMTGAQRRDRLASCRAAIEQLEAAASQSGYQVERLITLVGD